MITLYNDSENPPHWAEDIVRLDASYVVSLEDFQQLSLANIPPERLSVRSQLTIIFKLLAVHIWGIHA